MNTCPESAYKMDTHKKAKYSRRVLIVCRCEF